MPLKLYYHPLSSFCHKALIALYENDTPFEPVLMADEASGAALRALWPIGKFPVLRDEARQCTVAEATVIVEYLNTFYPGSTKLMPAEPALAWQARMWDRFYDLYVDVQIQKIVGDHLRPPDAKDPFGVEQARALIKTAYGMIEREMAEKGWALGDDYGLVECAASPALFYANTIIPFDPAHKNLRAYFERLMSRPSYARALKEAEPYFHMFPLEPKPRRIAERR